MKRPHDYSSPDSDTDELIDVGQEDSYCPVTGSMSPGSTSQILARKKRRGIIEKRRRDRINHSLSELRRLVPSAFEKQGSSKLEKAEILQMTVDHLKLLHAVGGKVSTCFREKSAGMFFHNSKGYFDARALAVDYWTLGFRECVGEVVRYLSSLEGMESTDPIGVRLVSHLSHCASELDPLQQSSAALPFTPWPWGSFPQLSSPSSLTVPSPPFASDSRRDLTPHAALLAYPSPALRMTPLGSQGALLSPAISLVRRLPSVPSRSHRLPEPPQEGPAAPTSLHSAPPPRSSSSPSSISSSSPTSSSASHSQVSFRPFAALGSPAPVIRGMGGSSKSAQTWGTEIGAF
ncbi:hairy/enhancer-of-split related with YRPW motif-like protein isoform X1 [Pygocentrus nattereri]|uniref:Hairy/enhancer-of-split related with YRPW motif-like protein n=1 Tax=Pygocentrus nattereri TaxID=42514 RepID=A0AAR2J8W5_PYGNA|nr:hairy/enhancer-of-split related with YRPW motif-like protein isoform X1 [Pygocentrus nattereri]